MTSAQQTRMAFLEELQTLTAAEQIELRNLRTMHADLCTAFDVLREEGFSPAWVAGQHIIANLKDGGVSIVRSLLQARLLAARL